MKIAFFTGSAYRHKYYFNKLVDQCDVVLHVQTTRSNKIIDEVPFLYSVADKKLLQKHSDDRLRKEKEYFLPTGDNFKPTKNVISVGEHEVNHSKVVAAVRKTKPDTVLIYGTGLLKKSFLEILPKYTINLHAGLSPQYRGAATLFWPIYFMEPQKLGFTFHLVDPNIDSGDIIHQNRPEIYANDELHDLGCRTIVKAAEDIEKLLKKAEKKPLAHFPQKSKGKIFYNADFQPYHLRVTNYLMRKGLLGEYLENKKYFPEMKLISQL